MNHTRWKRSRERGAVEGHAEPPEVIAEHEQIRLALELGQLVYDRRTALQLTQEALGERLGMTADEVEAIELGGLLPLTADLLVRLSTALDVSVDLRVVSGGHNRVVFDDHAAHSAMKPLLDVLPEAFPWVRCLPEADLHAFAVELVDAMRAADSVDTSASAVQLLIAWQHTAEVHAAPALLAALTRNQCEDYGSATDPRDRT